MHTSHTNVREKIQIVLQVIIKALCFTIYKTFYKLEIVGRDEAVTKVLEAKNKGKGMLFIANHTSELDGPFIRAFLPLDLFKDPMYYVSVTREHYHKGWLNWRTYLYGGWMFKLLGAFPAYRGMKDYQSSLVNHIELLEQQKLVCIFPEGKINKAEDPTVKIHGGAGFLADFTDTNIIPVKIEGLARRRFGKLIRITYKPMLNIHGLMQNARDKNLAEQTDLYKDVAQQVMDIVRG